jgi:hypothetical protein
MRYIFLHYLDENVWAQIGEAEQQRHIEEASPYVNALIESGRFLGGAPLHPTSTATTVGMRDGKRLITDGPFAETREQLGGYTLVEAKDLDEAIGIAAGLLGAESPARIEIRPLVEVPGLL